MRPWPQAWHGGQARPAAGATRGRGHGARSSRRRAGTPRRRARSAASPRRARCRPTAGPLAAYRWRREPRRRGRRRRPRRSSTRPGWPSAGRARRGKPQAPAPPARSHRFADHRRARRRRRRPGAVGAGWAAPVVGMSVTRGSRVGWRWPRRRGARARTGRGCACASSRRAPSSPTRRPLGVPLCSPRRTSALLPLFSTVASASR